MPITNDDADSVPLNAEFELIDLLRRRTAVCASLRDAPKDKRDLIDDLDIARSTVNRAVRELESADLVTYDGGTYALTPLGERLFAEFVTFLERTKLTVELDPVLKWIPSDEFDIDIRVLSDATVWTPAENEPYAMVNRHVESLYEVDEFRGISPIVGLHALEVVHERVLEEGARFEYTVEPGAAETLLSNSRYSSIYDDLRTQESVTVSVCERSIPYYLAVLDDETVQIGVDEADEPRALLETDRPEAVSWAHRTIDEYEAAATPLSNDITEDIRS